MKRRSVLKGLAAAAVAPYVITSSKTALASPGQYRLSGIGTAGGSRLTQYDLSAGLTQADVLYAHEFGDWVSSGGYAAETVPTATQIQSAAALCTSEYVMLDLELWNKTTEVNNYITVLQQLRTYLTAGTKIGAYNLGLSGYIAVTRCTDPYGYGTQVYTDFFEGDNDDTSAIAPYVDIYTPAMYFEKAIVVAGDFYLTGQAFKREISRLGIENKPICPWIWARNSNGPAHNTATITNATKTNPVRLTVNFDSSTGSNIETGDLVWVSAVGGMTQINNLTFQATKINSTTYDLYAENGSSVDGSAYSNYTSGGEMGKMSEDWEWRDCLKVCLRYLDGYILWAGGSEQISTIAERRWVKHARDLNAQTPSNAVPYGYTLKPKARR